ELSHGTSQIQQTIDNYQKVETDPYKRESLLVGLTRTVENEADLRSVVERVHKRGYSPYGARHFLGRLFETNGSLLPGTTHTDLDARQHAVDLVIGALTRVWGEKVNPDRPESFTPGMVAAIRPVLLSDTFAKMQLEEAQKLFSSIGPPDSY